tara:strand:+ start:1761 stop:3062 length:1302 start_codon:yes stop_codon:yes gene_type:complete
MTASFADYPLEHLKLALLTSGFSQSALVAVMLISFAASPRDPRFVLGLFMALYGLSFVGELGIVTGFLTALPQAVVPILIAPLFLGPVLYVYICILVDGPASIRGGWLVRHAIAPGFGALVGCALLAVPGEDLMALLRDEVPEGGVTLVLAILTALLVQAYTAVLTLVYLIKGYLKLRLHGAHIRSEFSNLERKTLTWVRYALISLGLFWIATMAADLTGLTDDPVAAVALGMSELLIFYIMAISGMRQGVIFGSTEPEPPAGGSKPPVTVTDTALADPVSPEPEAVNGAVSKYAKSGLTEADMARISAKIRQAMERDVVYENSNLSLTQLSRHIGVQAAYVSQTLTQEIGANFYDFVAQARIRAAMKQLADPANQESILTIALDVGFNSKSTFNSAFKRVCGTTPSNWRRNPPVIEPTADASRAARSMSGRP